jgi:hypothetical protein
MAFDFVIGRPVSTPHRIPMPPREPVPAPVPVVASKPQM